MQAMRWATGTDAVCNSPDIGVGSSKSQAPRSREAPIVKIRIRAAKIRAAQVPLELGAWNFFDHWSLEIRPSPVVSIARLNENQIGFVLSQGQMVTTHFDFHRVAEWRE